MLLSMTGFGEAHHQADQLAVAVEVRTINNRHLKINVRAGEGYGALEPEIEALVRQRIRRGTVQVNIRVVRAHRPEDYRLNRDVFEAYRKQLDPWATSNEVVAAILALPGVVEDASAGRVDAEADWPAIHRTLAEALDQLTTMRQQEGRAMETDLRANCQVIASALDGVDARAPMVANSYRDRLTERVRKIMSEQGVTVEHNDLLREVSIFADRVDISEEIVRLRSHISQFGATLAEESPGRKLEFVIQEMFREANTIGSKANDVDISRCVIEMKTAIERMREMIQNVE